MKGLLVKDLRLFLQQKKFFMVLLLVAVILNYNSDGTFIIGYLTVIGSFFVLSTIGYDEHGNSFAFLMTLPVMRKTYAREKYLFGFLLGGGEWLVATIISLIFKLVREGNVSLSDFFMEALLFIPIFVVLTVIMIPFQLKFGGEKGRMAMILAFGIAFLIGFLAVKGFEIAGKDLGQMVEKLSTLHIGLLEAICFAIAIGATVVSCLISSRIMERKEF